MQAELAQRQDDLELLQREVQAFRERAESAEAKAAAADHEYAELMKRFMSEKAEAMERVNQLNEEIASHRERLRAAGLNPDTPTGATGAALSESGAAVGGEEPAGAAAADQKRGWASSIFGGLAGRSQSRSTSSVLARSASASSRSRSGLRAPRAGPLLTRERRAPAPPPPCARRAPSYAFCVPPSAARMVVVRAFPPTAAQCGRS